MTDDDQDVIDHALRLIGEDARRRGPLCPECCRGRVNANSKHGFCSPCDRDYDDRIRESKRRSYHRRQQRLLVDGQPQEEDESNTGQESANVHHTTPPEELFTIRETADILRISDRQVRRLVRAGHLTVLPIGGRRVISGNTITAFLDSVREQAQ